MKISQEATSMLVPGKKTRKTVMADRKHQLQYTKAISSVIKRKALELLQKRVFDMK